MVSMRLAILHAVLSCLAALPVSGATVVTDALLEAVAHLESSGGKFTIGDGGRALGWWQMHEAAWQDTSDFRARQGLPTWDYEHAQNPKRAREYARDYLKLLEKQLRVATKEQPSVELIYAAYNVGFGRLRSLGFNIAKTPTATRASCARLQSLLATREASFQRNRSG